MKIYKLLLAIAVPVSTVLLTITLAARSAQATGPWYVAPGGSDGNTCLSALLPCATIDGAVGKVSPGDTILVAAGTYTGTDANGITLDVTATLSGGWNSGFTDQSGLSVIDGENARRALTVNYGISAVIDHFSLENGFSDPAAFSDGGGGILNNGHLTVIDSQIFSNTFGNSGYTGGSGGGGIKNWGTLELIGSSVNRNRLLGGFYGSGILSYGILTVTNSTIADNGKTDGTYSEGIYAYLGTISLNNSTVNHNNSAGIVTIGANVYLQNTILANQTNDCVADPSYTGKIISLGYNLIETSFHCTLTTTDRISIDPGLFYLKGQPAYYALSPNSPAIDAGNPAGCTDGAGVPLLTDQRGTARSLDGNQDGTAVCDIGAYEYDPANPGVHTSLLPIVLRNYCTPTPPLYFDDFGNPASGWPIADNGLVRVEYLGGEYRILISDNYRTAIVRPGVSFSDFIITVDVRNVNAEIGSFGVLFGQSADGSQFYTFEIDSDGYFAIWRYGSSKWTRVIYGQSSAINLGSAKNTLKLVRTGAQISAYVNGQLLTTVTDGTFLGSRYVGLTASTGVQYQLDARFDNFTVYPAGACLFGTAGFVPATRPALSDGVTPHGRLDDMINARR